MANIRLINPIEHDGALYRSIEIRRPAPIRFLRYWRRRHVPGPPPFRLDLPWHVIDRLHPVDHERLVAEMARLTQPFIWPIALFNFCFKKIGRNEVSRDG